MFLSFFLIIVLYFLITAVIAQFFPTAEFEIPTGIPNKKQKQKQKHIQ